MHLARLQCLGEVVEVMVPASAQEAARDLARAREDVRSELMGARHRLRKLLVRHRMRELGHHLQPGAAREARSPSRT